MTSIVARIFTSFAVLLLMSTGAAHASNWGSTGSPSTGGTSNAVSLLPDRNMSVKRVDLTTAYADSVNRIVSNVYAQTDLNAYSLINDTACYSANRVCAFDYNYGNNSFYGATACRSGTSSGTNPTRTCGQQYVKFNLYYTPPSVDRLVCHELAHTVGLRHGAETASCVYTPVTSSTSSALTAHDRSHINARY